MWLDFTVRPQSEIEFLESEVRWPLDYMRMAFERANLHEIATIGADLPVRVAPGLPSERSNSRYRFSITCQFFSDDVRYLRSRRLRRPLSLTSGVGGSVSEG